MKDSFSSQVKKIFTTDLFSNSNTGKTEKKNVSRSFQMDEMLFEVDNWGPPLYQSTAQSAYDRMINSYWTIACMEKYKSNITLVRAICQKWDQSTENWIRVPNHPIEQMIDKPNEYQTTEEFFSTIIENLWLTGNSLISIKDNKTSGRATLEALNTDMVRMDLNEVQGKLVDGYWVYKESTGIGYGAKRKFVPKKNMIHIRLTNSERLDWGISPLEALKGVQETEADAIEYNRSFMRNSGRSPFVISCPEPLSKIQMQAIQHAVADSISGRNMGLPIVLGYDMKPYSIGNTPVDIDYIKADRLNGERISAIFQVPSPLINITENATLANVKEFVKLFWTAGMIPKLKVIFPAISKYWIHPREGEDYRLWFDLTSIPELMDHTMSKAELLEKFADYGWSANELNVALELGLPTNDTGDIRRYMGEVIDWGSVAPPQPKNPPMSQPVDDANPDPSMMAEQAKRFRKARSSSSNYTKDELDRIWINTELSRKVLEDTFRQRISDAITSDFSDLTGLPVSAISSLNTETMISWTKEAKSKWSSILDRVWYDTTMYFINSFDERYLVDAKSSYMRGRKADLNPQNIRAISKIAEDRASLIVDTTTHYIIENVNNLLSQGYTEEEVVDKLLEDIPELSQFRAQVIVENEVVAAGNYGNNLVAEKSGSYTEKTWHTRRDNRVRPTHVTMEGETRLLSQRYSNQLRYPGDPEGIAREIINCRCFETYV